MKTNAIDAIATLLAAVPALAQTAPHATTPAPAPVKPAVAAPAKATPPKAASSTPESRSAEALALSHRIAVMNAGHVEQEGDMPETKTEARGEYRVCIDRRVVYRLREKAAKTSMAVGKNVTWQDLLRDAAEKAAGEVVK